jgi:hypothetical protein
MFAPRALEDGIVQVLMGYLQSPVQDSSRLR